MPYSSTNVVLYRFKAGKAFAKGQRFALDLPFDNAGAIFDLSSALSFMACAPFKLEPELDIKLEMDSAFAIPVTVEDYDYCVIQADGGAGRVNKLPYFIEKIDRVSDQVVRVRLLFDELNFMSAIGAGDGIAGFLSDRTRVTREHKDRFEKSNTGKSYLPIIDRFPEGISGNFRRTSKEAIELSEKTNGKGYDWTAFYFSDGTDATSPISSFLVADQPLSQRTLKAASSELAFANIPEFASLYFALPEASGLSVEGYISTGSSSPSRSITLGEEADIDGRRCVVMAARIWTGRKDGSTFLSTYFYKEWYDKNALFVKEEQVSTALDRMVKIVAPKCARVFRSASAWPTSMGAILRLPRLSAFFKKDVDVLERIVAESEIDRTALGLKKAICLPYRPFDRNDAGYLPEGCFVVAGKIMLASVDEVESTIEFTPKANDLNLPRMTAKPTEKTDGKAEALKLETKVYSSEFRFSKLVYDSFSIVLKGEDTYFNANLSETGNNIIAFKFFASPSMVSEFDFSLHSWPGFSGSDFILKPVWTEDYPLHLIINRNNETPVFTSAYLDYLRTGYNYDLKSQAVQLGMQGLGIAISAINAGVGIAATFATGGLAAPYAVSAATGFASSVANIGKTAAENQRGNAQRLKELQAQGASIAGNSDFAVSKRYTRNRVSLETYSVEPRVIDAARSFFYLKGYATDEIKAPTCHTRAHFDFVECDPVFKPEALSLFPMWILDLIADDLRQGVTVLHPIAGDYDIAQTSSNFELSVLNS